ncbi:hypothetical protein SASPL_101341 [Salvia splendens]|uniref:Uncharacterized protein n=1 Tax=Salvia splendens TaxID=180675 RepID=A0A8X9AB47_SALSN|nr:uncharacterized protein LOC121800600 [Salvia splendens]KAG6436442.1 hypothetical protein SASPL_101341 [Salvia splendens]
MSRVAAVESAGATRRQPLLTTSSETWRDCGVRRSKRTSRVGETAGECAAVCCCCPCTMVHLLILAVFRVPRGLWRKKKRKMLLRKKRRNSEEEAAANQLRSNSLVFRGGDEDWGIENDVVDWDNDGMWDRFYGAGFWRSSSQRSDE